METAYREQFIKFGLKVQCYRKLHGMTREAFADAIGKSWSFMEKVERQFTNYLKIKKSHSETSFR